MPDPQHRSALESELTDTAVVSYTTFGGEADHLARAAEAEGTAAPLLQIVRGPQAGLAFSLPPGVTVLGRGDESDIVLDDTSVSRRHAELHRTDDTIVLRDAGSLNGTYVNRQPITQDVQLADGDEIWTGKYRLLFIGR